jgi:ribosomal protein S28E/S33
MVNQEEQTPAEVVEVMEITGQANLVPEVLVL